MQANEKEIICNKFANLIDKIATGAIICNCVAIFVF